MRNAGLDEAQAGSRLPGEISITSDMLNITLMAESEEELKSHLMKVKEESENVGLKLNIQKMKIMAAVTICSDFGAPKIKSDTVSTVSPSISHEVMGLDAMIFIF